jgi:flagellar biogenesis protein FliO
MKTQVAVEESSLDQSSPERNKKRPRARATAGAKKPTKARSSGRTVAGKKISSAKTYSPEQENGNAVIGESVVGSEVNSAVAVEEFPTSVAVDIHCAEAIESHREPHGNFAVNGGDTETLDNFEVAACGIAGIDPQVSAQTPVQDNVEALPVAAREDPALIFQQNRLVLVATTFWNLLMSRLNVAWNWMQQKLKSQQGKKRLRVCESVSLGEKRFVAVIQVDGEQFLVGGSSSSVATLAHLERPREFSSVFQQHCEQDFSRA